jgi:dihydroorotate dehydrogenase
LEFSVYKSVAKPAIFLTGPETAHAIAKWLFKRHWLWKLLSRGFSVQDERLHVKLGSLSIPNPVGLAAGFDKNCEMSNALFQLGFGYLILGTVTLKEREGNPKPTIWRFPGNSIINSMGLPNLGARLITKNLSEKGGERKGPLIVSVSGLSLEEFVECYHQIEPFADAIELNISSPNAAGLRIFQEPPTLSKLLEKIGSMKSPGKPVWMKIPPYFNEQERENVLNLVEVCSKRGVDGITAINTKRIPEPRASIGTGGLSGPPIFEDMIRIVGEIYSATGGKIPINACGGISSGMDAWRAFEVGASSFQIYTAFIYEGPGIVSKMNRELLQMMCKSKLNSFNDVTGTGIR